MIKRRSTFLLGIFIILVSSSFLGLPSVWKNFFLFSSGIILIGLSIKFKMILPKKIIKKPLTKTKKQPPSFSGVVTSPSVEEKLSITDFSSEFTNKPTPESHDG